MRRLLALPALLLLAGCYAPVHEVITRDQDPALVAQAGLLNAIFWVVAMIGATIFCCVWVVCYYRNERERRR